MRKIVFATLILIVIILIVLFNVRPHGEVIKKYQFVQDASSLGHDQLTVQFLGNTNLLFSDGENAILTDGFFSRPPLFKMLFGKIKPDHQIIQDCLQKAGIEKLDAVIPVHSHFDHAMDAPVVADLTNAKLIGSSSTINIGKGYGLSNSQMRIPKENETIEVGKFKISFIPSRHWQYPSAKQRAVLLDQEIEEPLSTPAKMIDYKEGTSYTLIIEHDSISIGIQGSAGFKEGSLIDQDVDILFAAIAGLEVMDDQYNQNYQEYLIDALHPETLVPIHFDDFTVPLDKGLKTTNLLTNLKLGTNLKNAFTIITNNNKEKNIYTLPLWEEVAIEDMIR